MISIEIQTVQTTNLIQFESVAIIKEGNKLAAYVDFSVTTLDNIKLDNIRLIFKDEEYNEFWEYFNTGSYLYEKLIAIKGLTVTVDSSVEFEFVNTLVEGTNVLVSDNTVTGTY